MSKAQQNPPGKAAGRARQPAASRSLPQRTDPHAQPAGVFCWNPRWRPLPGALRDADAPLPAAPDATTCALALAARLSPTYGRLELAQLAAQPAPVGTWQALFDHVLGRAALADGGARLGQLWPLAAALQGLPFALEQLIEGLQRCGLGELRYHAMQNHGGFEALRERIAGASPADRAHLRALFQQHSGRQVLLDYLFAALVPDDPGLVQQALRAADQDGGETIGELFWLGELGLSPNQAEHLVALTQSQWIYPEMIIPMCLNFIRRGLPNALSLILRLLDDSGGRKLGFNTAFAAGSRTLPVGVRRQLFALVRAHDSEAALDALIVRLDDPHGRPQLDSFAQAYPAVALRLAARELAGQGDHSSLDAWLRALAASDPAALAVAMTNADVATRGVLEPLA